ncbi:YciK family oxidoreductase [Rheinheimera muenzenbergensis]|uniref:YciK family oxidoreductase n=1 Tax=Rheinheimera muenzenbergensis TaxID=1193628 RepID=A0ABU8CBE7_9GAMM|nr:YciK family oxidoreductase [Gammaproteobacteria bacterium]MBU1557144.1 YciK family oxidoreductase [Gammaproteobacteria bacterium]MBU2072350.1 YciK family oxidoreductase [Gammaproteobacteria bacterium]MBU2183842.1 YciK family oxidoreductase [Gammaproteobacteria bacterium]MBU2203946.1 YciK family oxidoreductase [Gammaproteobacteria bacterium]
MHNFQPAQDELKDKVILVTGAGDGIGKEAALSYARYGATVILLGKTVSKLSAVYDQIIAEGGAEPAIVPLDLKGATAKHYKDMAATIQAEFGRLDGVLHNAGILGVLSPFEHIDLPTWQDIMQVNVTGAMLMTQALIPVLKQAQHASVVFTSSGVGRTGRAYWGPYAVSKFATEGLMQVMADEYANSTLRVNCINPGATRTNMRARAYPGEDVNQLKTPAELMWLYLYLMSDSSLTVNGQSIDAQRK